MNCDVVSQIKYLTTGLVIPLNKAPMVSNTVFEGTGCLIYILQHGHCLIWNTLFFFKGNDILNAGFFFPLVLWLKKTQGFKLTVQDFDEGHDIE